MDSVQVERGFSSFFAIYQSGVRRNLEKSNKNGKNLANNEEKPCPSCVQPIFSHGFMVAKSRLQRPAPSLIQNLDRHFNSNCNFFSYVKWLIIPPTGNLDRKLVQTPLRFFKFPSFSVIPVSYSTISINKSVMGMFCPPTKVDLGSIDATEQAREINLLMEATNDAAGILKLKFKKKHISQCLDKGHFVFTPSLH